MQREGRKGKQREGEKKCAQCTLPYLTHQPNSLDMGTCKGLERESESRISVKGEKGGKVLGLGM